MGMKARGRFLDGLLATVFAVVLAVSMVPTPASASPGADAGTEPSSGVAAARVADGQDGADSAGENAGEPADELADEGANEAAGAASGNQDGSLSEEASGMAASAGILRAPAATLAPGTYSVTANVSMPGQYNPLIPGLTVYPTTQHNPFGPTIDENVGLDVQNAIPQVPVSANATLYVGTDGKATLLVPFPNPIFTLQDLGTCAALPDAAVERVSPTDWGGGGIWEGNYNARTSRIHKVALTLPETQTAGTKTYDFKGSKLYAVPLNIELAPNGNIALQLAIDYGSAVRTGDTTAAPALEQGRIVVNTPKAVEGLVSNGSEQTGVLMGKGTQGFTLTGEKAADAGVHTATATLKDGYVWADGTTGPKSIEYTIEANALDKAKAALQASIDAAQADLESVAESADGSDISPDAQWVTSTAAQELKDAVAAAKASLAAQNPTSESLTAAKDALDQAVAAFDAAKKPGTKQEPGTLAPGTYTVTANFSMPGKYNPILSDVTVYANNPNNPFGVYDENTPDYGVDVEVHTLAPGETLDPKNFPMHCLPMSPMKDNATLIVKQDGTRYLYLRVYNPAFTLQDAGTCTDLPDTAIERVTATGKTLWNKPGYNGKDSRIHKMLVKLTDAQTTGTATYNFKGSSFYIVPLQYSLAPDGDIAMQLDIDYDSATKKSDSVDVPVLVTDKTVVNKPAVKETSFAYNGNEQGVPVYENTGYTLSGEASALYPGHYSVTATLKDGYAWSDGTTAPVTYDWSISGPSAPSNKTIPIPTGTNVVFDNQEHNAVEAGEGYLVVNTHAVNAGSYETTLHLIEGCTWSDGTTEDKQVAFDIAPRTVDVEQSVVNPTEVSIVYTGEDIDLAPYLNFGENVALHDRLSLKKPFIHEAWQGVGQRAERFVPYDASLYPAAAAPYVVAEGGNFAWKDGTTDGVLVLIKITPAPLTAKAPDMEMSYGDASAQLPDSVVTGFVGGQDASTAKGYKAPKVSVKGHEDEDLATLAPGTYELEASGGSADNYEFASYEGGTLTVLPAGEAPAPAPIEGLAYTGAEQQGVATSEAYELSGDVVATNAGDYVATATLKPGYVWADGHESASRDIAWSIAKKKVARPQAASGLTYTGVEQQGVASSDDYELSGDWKATHAGDYVATATIADVDNLEWAPARAGLVAYAAAALRGPGGGASTMSIPWSIGKATLTASYAGETVEPGGSPAYAVSVTGFVGGEDAATASGYTAPAVTPLPAASLASEGSFELSPAGGAADDYDFSYASGTLVVKKAKTPAPDSKPPSNPPSGTDKPGGSADKPDGSKPDGSAKSTHPDTKRKGSAIPRTSDATNVLPAVCVMLGASLVAGGAVALRRRMR
ncbi:MBG domain-containing protein [Slackia exigua]|uniref:MBG domain-containing protein n=1 Tax=Slackia exigua TaxID=84109 RepID=UPI0020064ED9|nr:MBG domain-containing protein [Slackia exigua]